MTTSTHELAAKAIIRLSPTGTPAEHREVMEALGIIEPGATRLAPDPRPGASQFVNDQPIFTENALSAPTEPVRYSGWDMSSVPAGLASYTPDATPRPRPARKPAGPKIRQPRLKEPRQVGTGRGHNGGPQRQPINHGTSGGYRSHLRYGPEPCQPCRDAECARQREGKARRRDLMRALQAQQRAELAASPAERTAAIIQILDRWVGDAQSSHNPAVHDAATVVAGALVRLRVAVDQLDQALRAPEADRRSA